MAKLQLLNHPDASVTFELADCDNGKKVGFATLNVPKALNALNLDMIRLLTPQLTKWANDDDIVMVVLKGSGEKSFCAGGDVVSLYKAMSANDGNNHIETFFSEEYTLDYQIHTYEKPILLWGNGIIMGGGLGLMAGASHRVVTETARIAMPEITIGLYPDVGGSYFLNKMPTGVGLFLGLTGASINAKDAQLVGLADHFIHAQLYGEVLASLLGTDWKDSAEYNHGLLSEALHSLQSQSTNEPASEIEPLQHLLADLETKESLESQIDAILSFDSIDNKWLSRAQKSLHHGSPLSARLISEQLKRAHGLSLADCFRLELGMSVAAAEFGEFQEGVRALLIDKDGSPNWQFENTQLVTDDAINIFFKSRWSEHPLRSL